MNHVSDTYVVWFRSEFDEVENAALALNGQVLQSLDDEHREPRDVIVKRLCELGFHDEDIVHVVLTTQEYIFNEIVHEATPSHYYNIYSAAVMIPTP